jgi:hypothetical protein
MHIQITDHTVSIPVFISVIARQRTSSHIILAVDNILPGIKPATGAEAPAGVVKAVVGILPPVFVRVTCCRTLYITVTGTGVGIDGFGIILEVAFFISVVDLRFYTL